MSMCTPPSMKFTFCMRRVSWSVCNSTLRASCWGPIRPGCISPRWEHLPPQSLWASAALKGAPHHENSDFFCYNFELSLCCVDSFLKGNIFFRNLCVRVLCICVPVIHPYLYAEVRAGCWFFFIPLYCLENGFPWTDALWVRVNGKWALRICLSLPQWLGNRCL